MRKGILWKRMAAVALTAVLAAAALPQQIPAAEKTVGGLTAFVHEIEPSGTEPRLNKSKLKLMEGDTAGLKVKNFSGKIKWKSENDLVASVDPDGWVRAEGEGTTRIRAKAGKRRLYCKVKVWAPSITLDQTSLTLIIGEEKTLTAETFPEGSYTSWESDNPGVATVKNGVVTGRSLGAATITAKMRDVTASCVVTVTGDGIALSESELRLRPGEVWLLKAATAPAGAEVSWESSNDRVVNVINGAVTALAEGTALIIASTEKDVATCRVEVRNDW